MTDRDIQGPPAAPRRSAAGRDRLIRVRRAVLNRRSLGRAIMVAAVVAAVTCLVGIVVAWLLVGDLAHTTKASLVLAGDTLETVDDTLDVADSVIQSVDGGVETVQQSLTTMATAVENGAATLEVVADLTANLGPNLEQIDRGLGGLQSTVDVVDGVLQQLSDLPFGPDYDPDTGLAASVQEVREDLQPITEDLANASGPLGELAASSDDALDRLDDLATDLDSIAESLSESRNLIERYRESTAQAAVLAAGTVDDLNRDVWLSRVLILILGVTIAVGQIAPFSIGRELARTPAPPPLSDVSAAGE
jgi:methyl-accepting chemotaxis protein